ncbi:hypothetical protein [Pseudomonas sp. NPDC088444]|uniref:hypothetical protein n=1 Tax=Pseudomonas sp. NPDC088444 TaxID=3364456 RepID=UPI003850AA38
MTTTKKPTICAFLLTPYVEALQRSGIDTDMLMARFGIDRSVSADMDGRIPVSTFFFSSRKPHG